MSELLWQSLAFPATAALIVFFRRHAPQLGLVDVPGGRKQHHDEVPMVGGLAMFGGLVVAALATGGVLTANAAILAGLALLVLLGFVDDRNELSARTRFIVQAAAALIMVYWGGVRLDNLGNLFGYGDVIMGRWSVPMTVFAVLGVINAMNMIDGADGLAGGLALMALLVLSVIAGGDLGGTLLLPLAAAVAGFLVFNLRTPWRDRASVFMGDAGSMLLGFALAWYTVDILQRAGFTHGQTVVIVQALALLLAGIGVAGWKLGVPEYVMFYAFMALFGLYLYGVLHAWKLMKTMRKLHDAAEHVPHDVKETL
jgi:UDP-GlcNAc:undecaprenyl-phosphate GlcNAc-1-phosphate transferase